MAVQGSSLFADTEDQDEPEISANNDGSALVDDLPTTVLSKRKVGDTPAGKQADKSAEKPGKLCPCQWHSFARKSPKESFKTGPRPKEGEIHYGNIAPF